MSDTGTARSGIIEARQVDGRLDARNFPRNPADFVNHLPGPFQRRGVRQLSYHCDVAFILRGNEAGRDDFEPKPRQTQQPKIDHEGSHAEAKKPSDYAAVGGRARSEDAIESAEKPAESAIQYSSEPIRARVMGLQEQRAKRRAKC